MSTRHTILATPIGDLTVVRDDAGITGVYFPHHWTRPDRTGFGPRVESGFEDVAGQLAEYLAGERREFDLPVHASGDPVQERVWGLIAAIPYGRTTTYGELARALGDGTHRAGGRRGGRRQPAVDPRRLPPRGRQRRHAHRLRRRPGPEAAPARPGVRAAAAGGVLTGNPPFERVVAEHGPTVLRVCRAVLGPADADDAWSETFLAALRAYPDLPADANVEAWLVTIAHRKAIDVTRAAARRAVPVGRRRPSAGVRGRPCADLDLRRRASPRCPPKQRQAVAYHYLAGLPYAEVAADPRRQRRRRPAGRRRRHRRRCAAPYPERAPDERRCSTDAFRRRPDPTESDARTGCTPGWPPRPTPRASSTSPTGPSTPRSARCCWPRPSGPGPRRLRRRGPRRACCRRWPTGSARGCCARPARLDPAARRARRVLRRPPARVRPAAGLAAVERVPRARCCTTCTESATATPRSYAAVAALAGNPKAVRAVGTACATNPLPVVVPCHRVVRSDGAIGGYAGGVDAKRTLLDLEAAGMSS